jgi:hypothetical protein
MIWNVKNVLIKKQLKKIKFEMFINVCLESKDKKNWNV